MTPEEATRLVESREVFGMRFGLERMVAVLAELGDPQRSAAAIHVVGTNGKSSTTRFAQAVLTAQGLRVGSYVSPHVEGWPERIMLDGAPVGDERFAAAVGSVVAAEAAALTGGDKLTQFEVLTAAAFCVFAAAGVDAMVIEAGLGGRFDATNVFDGAAVVVLTTVGLDHTQVLGHTEAAIAAEKLAVCADGADRLVVGALTPTADVAVRAICAERGLRPWFLGGDILVANEPDGAVDVTTPRHSYAGLRLAVAGSFQRDNAATAIAAAELLLGRPLDSDALRVALSAVTIPGRLECVAGRPLLVLDGAHNPHGMAALAQALPEVAGGRPVVSVVSIFADKDLAAIAATLAPVVSRIVATGSSAGRSASAEQVGHAFAAAGADVVVEPDPDAAIERARHLAGPGGVVLVCGSLALIAQARAGALRAWSGGPGMLAGGKFPEIVNKAER